MKLPEHMSFDGGNVVESRRRWEQLFHSYMIAGELTNKTKATRVAISLHCAGPQALDIHGIFKWGGEEDKDNVDTVLRRFQTYCKLRKNVVL